MSLYKRGSFWWSRIVRNGESFSRSTKCKNKADAIRIESNWIQVAEHGISLHRTLPTTLSYFEKRFFEYIETNVASPKTRAYYKTHFVPLRDSAIGNCDLQKITSSAIHDWVQARSKDVGPSSVNGSLRTLRRAMRLAHEWNIIKTVPKIRTVKGEKNRDFVIDEKLLAKMLAHKECTVPLKRLLPFLIDTGLRLGEAMSLTWDNVKDKSIFIAKGKTKNARRLIPLTPRAQGILEELKTLKKETQAEKKIAKAETKTETETDEKVTVFALSAFTVSHQFNTLRNEMELPSDCVLHSCRHTFCTRLGNSGVSAFQIMRLAGHSNVNVSQRYVHEDQQALTDAIAKLGNEST